MKKLALLLIAALSSSLLAAQDECADFFPNKKGSILINKCYDAKGNLTNTVTYRVDEFYSDASNGGNQVDVTFVISNSNGKTIDDGTLKSSCDEGIVTLSMDNKGLSQEVLGLFATNTKFIGDFLNYPDISDLPSYTDYDMNDAEYVVKPKKANVDFVSVSVYNRKLKGDEQIKTPAGTFNAHKIVFDFESTRFKKKTSYKGIQWYVEGAGIVRSETYDVDGNLINYSELTTLTVPK